MYKNKTILQIGSHVGNTENDPIFKEIDETTQMVLVEPVPYLFNKLKENYKTRLKDITRISFINKAVSNFVGELELNIPSERNDFSQLPAWASQLASVHSNHATDHIPHLIVDTIKVQTTTIDDIINDMGLTEIDLLHTDTEGHDYTILMDYSFSIKPRQVLFENKHMDGVCKKGINYETLTNKLVSMGYTRLFENTEDTMFELTL